MSAFVRVGRKTLRTLADAAGEVGTAGTAAAVREARRILGGDERRRDARRATGALERSEREARRDSRVAVRDAVFSRAGDRCEACQRSFHLSPPTLDHFYGRSRFESLETCWALCVECHRQKTQNLPDAAYWLIKFVRHCELHARRLHRRLPEAAQVYVAAARRAAHRLDGIVAVREASA